MLELFFDKSQIWKKVSFFSALAAPLTNATQELRLVLCLVGATCKWLPPGMSGVKHFPAGQGGSKDENPEAGVKKRVNRLVQKIEKSA